MRLSRIVVLGVFLLTSCCLLMEPIEAAPGLIELTNENFFHSVTDHDKTERFAFVMFYAPWCQVCKAMERTYGNLANWFSQSEFYKNKITVCRVNAPSEAMQRLARQEGVYTFPVLKLYGPKMLKPITYEGETSFEDMQEWLMKQIDSHYDTEDELSKKKEAEEEERKKKSKSKSKGKATDDDDL